MSVYKQHSSNDSLLSLISPCYIVIGRMTPCYAILIITKRSTTRECRSSNQFNLTPASLHTPRGTKLTPTQTNTQAVLLKMATKKAASEGAASSTITPSSSQAQTCSTSEEEEVIKSLDNLSIALDNISKRLKPLFDVPWPTLMSK